MRSAGYVGPFKARHGSCNMAENDGKCVLPLLLLLSLKHVLLLAVTLQRRARMTDDRHHTSSNSGCAQHLMAHR